MRSAAVFKERGQSAIVITLMLVGLLAMLGLAFDGGNAYVERRRMQNAADAGAFAGARVLVVSHTKTIQDNCAVRQAIETYALSNGIQGSAPDPTCNTLNGNIQAFYIDQYGKQVGTDIGSKTGVPTPATGVCVIAKESNATFFLGVVGISQASVSAETCAQANPPQAGVCGGGYAVWANSTTCTNDVIWSGKSYNVSGNVHSNTGIQVTGSSNDYSGTCEYYTTLSGSSGLQGSWTQKHLSSQNTTYPINYLIADYQPPSGRAALAAGSNYYSFNGNTTVPFKGSGLYYVNGDATINWSSFSGSFTFVATGRIIWNAVSGSDLKPFIDGLWMFSTASTDCNNYSIVLNGQSNNWDGNVFAPNGGIDYEEQSDSNYSHTSFVGDHVKLGGQSNNFNNLSPYCNVPASPGTIHLINPP